MQSNKNKKYILFGTGDYYKRFRRWFDEKDVVAILDNDVNKQGCLLDGSPVVAPSSIADYVYDVVVILSFYVTEMKKQLVMLGVEEDRIFHFYDLHELIANDDTEDVVARDSVTEKKGILLLSHDLTLGGPALALYHAALVLVKNGYEVTFASMLDGELRCRLEEASIPVVIDDRLQIRTMRELSWTSGYQLIICNTINYHTFLMSRDVTIPVIWWLHDSAFFYEGIRASKLQSIDMHNLKLVSVGPVPANAMRRFRPDAIIEDLIYGVSHDT